MIESMKRTPVRELRQYLSQKDMSQEELARQLNVTTATMNRWLNRKQKPRRASRRRLEQLLAPKRESEK